MLKIIIIFLSFYTYVLAQGIVPIPVEIDYDKKKAALGKKLFFDTLLSKDKSISCSSCHALPGSGADVAAYSFGVNGAEGAMNTPTVLNSGFNFVQFWDGRAKTLEEQVLGPLANKSEMDISIPELLQRLKKDRYYKNTFNELYSKGLNKENFLNAIAEFERALITPNSDFDKFLRGDKNALNAQAKKGYELFRTKGCISCHNGVNIGGNMYQKLGIMQVFVGGKKSLGRYEITKDERDKYFFKVPSLRNIALTSPYLHDGSQEDLQSVIKVMMQYQLGVEPQEDKVLAIEAFLKSLTGKTPEILKAP